MKILILLHSLDKKAGGVERRISELEVNLPKNIDREYLLYKQIVTLPHFGKVNFIPSLKIPKFILKNKNKIKLLAYILGGVNFLYRVYKTKKFLKNKNYDLILAVDDYF